MKCLVRQLSWALCMGIPLLIPGWFVKASKGTVTGVPPSPALVSRKDFQKLQNAVQKLQKESELRNQKLEANLNRLNMDHLKLKKRFTYEMSHFRAAKTAVSYMEVFKDLVQRSLPFLGAYHWLKIKFFESMNLKNHT